MKRKQRPTKLLRVCGIIGLVGCFCVVAANFIGILVVEQHNPISETISKLAIGKYAWIQDIGLDLFAAAILATAVGLYALHLEATRWKIGVALLVLLSIDIVLIAEHNQYAGREGVGASIHLQCVYALGLLFALSTLLLAFGLRRVGRAWYHFSLVISIAWTVLGPIFFWVPTRWDGIVERLAALVMVSWFAAISWLLLKTQSSQEPLRGSRGES